MKPRKNRLQRFKGITVILFICSIFFTVNSFAEIPKLINYQGRLSDSQGQPITGTKSVTFRIYDVESGGSPLWQETHTTTFDRGIFNLFIGGVTPLNLAFDKQYYLGIQVGNDPEMTPRQRLTSSAYAFRANVADEALQAQNAAKVNNIEASTTPQPNKLLALDANGKFPLSVFPARSQTFTSSGVFTVPAGISTVSITMIGGGGGGGGGFAYTSDDVRQNGGGGGASGESFTNSPVSVTPGNTYNVSVGTGGGGGAANSGVGASGSASAATGTAGGNSSFGTLLVARGGYGGGGGNYARTGGQGGAAFGGPGQSESGAGASGETGGKGGSGALGGIGGTGGNGTAGGNGSGYGAGGGGGWGPWKGTPTNGGNGSAGFVLVHW